MHSMTKECACILYNPQSENRTVPGGFFEACPIFAFTALSIRAIINYFKFHLSYKEVQP